jgi:hypothetical protein
LVPVRKQPGLKAGAFSPALLVPVATTGTNGLYKPGLKAFFPPVLQDEALAIFFSNYQPFLCIKVFTGDPYKRGKHKKIL